MIKIKRMMKLDKEDVKAFFDVVVNDIDINGIKLVKSKSNGELFVAFPAVKGKDSKYYNTCYINDINLKSELLAELIKSYEK